MDQQCQRYHSAYKYHTYKSDSWKSKDLSAPEKRYLHGVASAQCSHTHSMRLARCHLLSLLWSARNNNSNANESKRRPIPGGRICVLLFNGIRIVERNLPWELSQAWLFQHLFLFAVETRFRAVPWQELEYLPNKSQTFYPFVFDERRQIISKSISGTFYHQLPDRISVSRRRLSSIGRRNWSTERGSAMLHVNFAFFLDSMVNCERSSGNWIRLLGKLFMVIKNKNFKMSTTRHYRRTENVALRNILLEKNYTNRLKD